jgi:hypothetical protein
MKSLNQKALELLSQEEGHAYAYGGGGLVVLVVVVLLLLLLFR